MMRQQLKQQKDVTYMHRNSKHIFTKLTQLDE